LIIVLSISLSDFFISCASGCWYRYYPSSAMMNAHRGGKSCYK
jgi:hypothetical protein